MKAVAFLCAIFLVLVVNSTAGKTGQGQTGRLDDQIDRHHVEQESKEARKRAIVVGSVIAGASGVVGILQSVSSLVTSGRACVIALANTGSKSLVKPTWYTDRGAIKDHAPFKIGPNSTGVLEFDKGNLPGGTDGVVVYEIEGTKWRVAIMWTVPFSSSNHYNVKVYEDVKANKDLYRQMLNYANPRNAEDGGYLISSEHGVNIRGSMTDGNVGKLGVWIDASNLEASEWWTHLNHGCSTNTGWFGNFCWRECPNAAGWCWINSRCSGDTDCQKNSDCYTKCG